MNKKTSSILLLTGAIIELIVAILHFVWPFNFVQLPVFENISETIKDFILLASLALGLCMTVFSYFSLYFSQRIKHETKSALIFSLTQAILWTFRLIFEILFPVKVPLYSIESPSGMVIIGSIVVILVYLIPVFLLRKTLKNYNY